MALAGSIDFEARANLSITDAQARVLFQDLTRMMQLVDFAKVQLGCLEGEDAAAYYRVKATLTSLGKVVDK